MKRLTIIVLVFILFCGSNINGMERFPSSIIPNIPVIQLEPTKLTTFDQYKKQDLADQKKYHGIWSTINTINLDSLKIALEVSSTLGSSYSKSNLFDKKIETAWVEGAKDDGIGEWIKVQLDATLESPTSTPFSIYQVGVIPGYSKNQKTWIENNRVKSVLIVIQSPSGFPRENECVVFRLKLKDSNKLQIFNIPVKKVAGNYLPMTKTVWFKVEDIYKGTKFKDTCISEIVLMGACSS